jgi:(2S)-methylsuccinyl-CoA dehydrogenase
MDVDVENAELAQVRTLMSTFEQVLNAALANAARQTSNGKNIDDFQVHCERIAYRATEFRAAQALLSDVERQGQSGQDTRMTGSIALAYTATALQGLWSDVHTHLADYGFSESFIDQMIHPPHVVRAMRLGMAESVFRSIGRAVIETDGINNTWLGDELSELTRQTVRDFTRQEIEPIAERLHRQDELAPDALIEKMGDLGFFAMSIPEAYGGTGMGFPVMIITTEELSRGSLGAAGSLITRPEIVARALLDGGTEAQKQRWLPRIASGEWMVAVSVTEPDVGSDVASLTCRAEAGTLPGDGRAGYFIHGAKAWCTFAGRSEIIGLLARTDPDRTKGARGLSLFIIEKERFYGHEIEITQAHGGTMQGKADATLGYRGMHSFTINYDNFFVPAANLIGEESGLNRGFYLQMSGFANGRLQTGGRALGLAQAALEKTVAYVKTRSQFGKEIAAYQLTQYKLGRMATQLAAARQLTYAAARHMEMQSERGLETAMAKLLACDVAVNITQEGQLLHGGWGYAEETPISRYVVDALVLPIFEGVKPILELKVIARSLLQRGKPA